MKFLFLSGSFRSNSYSLAIFKNIEHLFADHIIEIPQLDLLPFYSEDLELEKPTSVALFLQQVNDADGVLICSPEYNHSIPAVLKNALDWASRPAFDSPLKNMPVSIITQAGSPVGGARAQAHIKLVLDSMLAAIHVSHEMMISEIAEKFDLEMKMTDKETLSRIERHTSDFIQFTKTII